MCTEIVVNGVHCDTIGQLAAAVGRENIRLSPGYLEFVLTDETCLCPVDTKLTARGLKMRVKRDPVWQIWESLRP